MVPTVRAGRGADGASDQLFVAAQPVEVVDTIGAGDTFGAGLLDAVWDHLGARLGDLEPRVVTAALPHAARCAAITVSRVGADPPWRASW